MNTGKKVAMAVCGLLAVGAAGTTLFWFSRRPASLKARNPNIQTTKSKFEYITSKEFGGLPDSEKVKYVKAANPRELFGKSKKLSDADKKKLFNSVRPVFRAMRKAQVNEYLSLKNKTEQTAYLDKMIDARVERWKSRESVTGVKKRNWKGPSMSKIKERIETSDPKERAKWMEFRMGMRQRMKERKITPPWAKR